MGIEPEDYTQDSLEAACIRAIALGVYGLDPVTGERLGLEDERQPTFIEAGTETRKNLSHIEDVLEARYGTKLPWRR